METVKRCEETIHQHKSVIKIFIQATVTEKVIVYATTASPSPNCKYDWQGGLLLLPSILGEKGPNNKKI